MARLRIIFMGTPEFAVSILSTLVDSLRFDIVGVVTAPDKPAGRGRKIHTSAVKEYAIRHDLELLQPPNLKSEEFIDDLKALNADLFVVVAFRMLPEIVWSMPRLGTINLHASLLPQYRGAAPINWAIINGEKQTGVTTFFIEQEIDTGKIIEQRALAIGTNETVGELYLRLMQLGAETTLSSLLKIQDGQVSGISQSEMLKTQALQNAPKIFTSDCKLDFTKTALEVHNFCRGLDPYPGAWCEIVINDKGERKIFKFFGSRLTDLPSNGIGVISKNSSGLLIPCRDFHVLIMEIQPDGKRKMTANEYLIGHDITSYMISH